MTAYFVLVPPKVEAQELVNDQSCVWGQDTRISWKFSGIEKPQVTWLFNGQLLPTNVRIQSTETDDGTAILLIHKAELADQGVYIARAANTVGEAEAKTTLNIVGIKPSIITDLDNALQITIGETMKLKITANGIPKPDIVWMRNNNELAPSDRIQMTTTTQDDNIYTLTLLNIEPKDQGAYSANISNFSGSLKSKECQVTVSSMPF